MSTYLVEFIIADFGFVENMTASGIPHRIYAQSGQLNRTDYPLWFGTNTLDFFESYFNVPYTLAKLDEVAIPDFVSGGMEHWGVITYRESNLLYDDMHSSTYNKERVAMIIGHEIVHQWWGNLVTCDWWNDLWLNEGSARWLQQIVADTFNPEFEAYNIFISSYLLGVLDVDATVNSRPVYVAPSAVEHPDEITAIFDDVVYSKGASMLRYLENLLGASVYRDGLEGLLKGLAFKTMVTDDYWDYMSRASGKDVKTMMDPWTLQMGYPVIDVTRDPKDRLKVTLRQERFLLNPDADLSTEQFPSPFNYTWDIYIEYITSDNPHTPYRVHMKMGEEVRLDWPDVEWVKLNYGFTTFCRVNYELQDWLRLSQLLVDDHTALAPSDRVNLLSDAFALAEARRLDYGVPLNMTRYLDREDHYVPWHGVYRRLADISTLLYYRPDYDLLRRYIVAKVDPSFQKLGWDVVGTHLEKRLRPDLIELACWHGDAECIRVATDLFTSWLEAEAYLHPDVRNLVYKYGMIAVGGTDEWEIMWQRYKSEINAQERINLMYGLANSRMPWVLQRYLILAWDLNNVRMQDYWTVLGYIADNPVGRPIVWDYYRANWDSFVERFTLNDRTFGRFIQIVTASFTTDFHLQQMLDFYAQHPDAGAGELPRRQALETVQGNIAWLQRNEADIIDWLHLYGNS
ncbi:PREDICTED: glutamyl aminopeptidase-like [Priapulus caudatus]|uniref:glutamyl aminopeptidase n=1 Tax=Priapulus caudatus TaxID=37621 RepID=A0ABM1EXD2_PRICU|nr:PREDICTED: glutamyl aminopeptidase-like [Priapulus caudatus]